MKILKAGPAIILSGIFFVLNASGAGLPDPTLLPVANTSQAPNTAAYDALNVPGLPAGFTYSDPISNVKIYKLTSNSFPAAGNWGHDYADGGHEVSLPHTGTTRTILTKRNGGATYYLFDFTPGSGVSNARQLTGTFSPDSDLHFTFSSNPATPYYAFVGNGSNIVRFDVRTMTAAPGGGWPVPEGGSTFWLHQSKNDGLFTWMRGASGGSQIVGYEPSTATLKTRTNGNANEPRIDRDGRYIGFSMDTPNNGLSLWDWQTNTESWTYAGDAAGDGILAPFAHNGSVGNLWITSNFNTNNSFSTLDPVAERVINYPGAIPGQTAYVSCNWVGQSGNILDRWWLTYAYASYDTGASRLAHGGMVFGTVNGQRRFLAHAYSNQTDYFQYAWGKASPDGFYVLFTSDMHGSGRYDLFLAEVPVSGGTALAPPKNLRFK